MTEEPSLTPLTDLLKRYPSLHNLQQNITKTFQLVRDSLAGGGTLFLCGNGGSAADAEHIAGELLKGFLRKRPLTDDQQRRILEINDDDTSRYLCTTLQRGLRAIALTGHPSLATAVSNDLGADLAFAQQVFAMGRPGDVLLGLSTSGYSRNVLLAARVAKSIGMNVAALTGQDGGELARCVDAAICVPARKTHLVQELHLPVYHTLCSMLEEAFFGDE
ncbi:MAG: SIS domain-containing protein [Candidatus Pacebacteria bacterium]|nr:SIS domain-containing protein [Candidatus Paceibacterota bacterium]